MLNFSSKLLYAPGSLLSSLQAAHQEAIPPVNYYVNLYCQLSLYQILRAGLSVFLHF